jgi:hypothetical protein
MLSTRELLASLPRQDLERHERVLRDCLADHLADVDDTYQAPSVMHTVAPARRCNGQNGPVGQLVNLGDARMSGSLPQSMAA